MAFTATLRPRCTLQLGTSPRRPTKPPPPTVTTATTTLPPSAKTAVAAMWRQVQGSGDWDGLLQPLHPVLCGEVARYGALVGACYDALDMDRSSAGYMRCKFRRETMLDDAAAAAAAGAAPGYDVMRYIYAAPDVAAVGAAAPWVGYVAVSTDDMTRRLGRRDVLVAFRGTVTPAEWTANLMSLLRPARLGDARRHPRPDVKVESGFLNLYTSSGSTSGRGRGRSKSCREQLLGEVSRLLASFAGHDEDVGVKLAGHSMGGALALLLGYDLAELGLLDRRRGGGASVPVSVLSFGAPRVGNAAFKAWCDALGVKALRVANVRDPVTMLPGALLNERTGWLLGGGRTGGGGGAAGAWCYVHVGVELALDFAGLRDLGAVHDLGAYVSCLAQGGGGGDRDGGQRKHRAPPRPTAAPRRRGGYRAPSGGGGSATAITRAGDRLQLTALGFLLFLFASVHHWPLINPLLAIMFSNPSFC